MAIRNPIFICGCHKSGTSLLKSLFDAAPGVYALPLETHFFQAAGRLIDYPYRSTRPTQQTAEQLVGRMVRSVAEANAHSDFQSYGVLDGRVDVERFTRTLRGELPSGPMDLAAYFSAYARSLHEATFGAELPAAVRVVEKSVENAEVAAYWSTLFPDASFVHIVRNPYANLDSLRKYKTVGRRYPYLRKPLEALESSYDYVYRNRSTLPRYFVVRYEDLVNDPEGEMKRLCEELQLIYDPGMSEPTLFGEAWRGNSTSGRPLSGVSTNRLDAWEQTITSLEVFLINRRFGHVFRDFDYQREPESGSIWRPSKGESLMVYIRNRVLCGDIGQPAA